MKSILSALVPGALSLFVLSTSAFSSTLINSGDEVQWDSSTHRELYLDANGDGVQDVLLQAVDGTHSPKLIAGKQVNFTTHYLADSELFLSLHMDRDLDAEPFDATRAHIVTGFFNGDDFEDALVILDKRRKAYLMMGSAQGLTDIRRFSGKKLAWLKKSESKQYYPGDFNGDGQSDLLVLMTDTGNHKLYHSTPEGDFVLAQTIKQPFRWGLKKNEKLYIADFNGDGRDDVFALAKKRKKKHYLAYANEKGLFKRKNVQVLKAKFTDVEWVEEGHSTAIVHSQGKQHLVRLYNKNGGLDDTGRYTPNDNDPLRHESCKYVYFSPGDKQSGKRCELLPENGGRGHEGAQIVVSGRSPGMKKALKRTLIVRNGLSTGTVSDKQSASLNGSLAYAEGGSGGSGGEGSQLPVTPVSAPVSSVGAYPRINQSFSLSWNAVTGANKYEIWASYDYGVTVENTHQYTSGTSFNLAETYAGSRFYYIKACNALGCSGLSPYQSVYIYSKPDEVPTFVASPSTVQVGETVNLSWVRPDGIIGTGGYYKILQTKPDGSTVWLPNVSGGHNVSTSVVLNAGQGQYNFKIVACNKTESDCSTQSPFEANAAVIPPPGDGSAVINNLTYTPVVVPVGKPQSFSFDYLNSTWCRNSLGNNYVGSNTGTVEDTGQFNWSTNRTSAATWEFDVICSNKNNNTSYSQHVSTIITANKGPVAVDEVKTVAYGDTSIIRVLDNDYDDDGHELTITSYSQPHIGSVSCTDVCTYTAPSNSSSNARTGFVYTISDGWGGSMTAQAIVDLVSSTPDPHVSLSGLAYSPQTVTVGYTQSFSFSYTNARECISSLGVVYVADNGQLQSGTYSWGPTLRETPATWDFTVTCSNNDTSASASVLGVINPTTNPVAVDDAATVEQYSSGNVIDVLNNDSDADGHTLTIAQVSQPLNGIVSITPDNLYVTYAPKGDFTGTETFTYIADDGWGGTAQAIVTVTVGEASGDTTGLIAEYLFENPDNLGFDSSGNGNHAILDGNPVQAPGKIGFSMDTANGALDKLPGFNKGQMVTINFWFRTTVGGYLMQQGYWEGGYPAWELRPMVTMTSGDLKFVALGDDGTTRKSISVTSYVNNFKRGDIWFMVTMITDGDYFKAYVSDGRGGFDSVGPYNSAGPDTWSANQAKSARKIGALCYYGNSNCLHGYHYFDGQIDNYRMYGRALTLAEIRTLYAEIPAPPNNLPEGEVTIEGGIFTGSELSATDTLTDADGLGTFSYQWQRHKDGYDFDIDGATASTYTVTANDVGYTLSVAISYIDGAGHNERVSSAHSIVVPSNAPPTISVIDDVMVDEDIPSSPIAFTVGDAITPLDELIIMATSGDQLLIPDDNILIEGTGENRTLTLTPLSDMHGEDLITVIVSDGELDAEIDFTLTVNPVNDSPTGEVTIKGVLEVGQVLTADISTIEDVDGLGDFNYQWLRNQSNIQGAIAQTYTLTNEDLGSQISVEVSYIDGDGFDEKVTSEEMSVNQPKVRKVIFIHTDLLGSPVAETNENGDLK